MFYYYCIYLRRYINSYSLMFTCHWLPWFLVSPRQFYSDVETWKSCFRGHFRWNTRMPPPNGSQNPAVFVVPSSSLPPHHRPPLLIVHVTDPPPSCSQRAHVDIEYAKRIPHTRKISIRALECSKSTDYCSKASLRIAQWILKQEVVNVKRAFMSTQNLFFIWI